MKKRQMRMNILGELSDDLLARLFAVAFLEPNFIFARGARDGGAELVGDFLDAGAFFWVLFFVDLRSVFLGDFLVVFLAGMVWLLRLF